MKRVGISLLGAWLLLALPAVAQQDVTTLCEEDCTTNNGVELRACMEACPVTTNPKDRVFLKCANKCADTFNTKENACKARCNKGKADPAATKPSKSKPIRKHSSEESED
ncbi:hypothetical protein [Melittangium boletus]|uniref:Lipoprotein n=1 Tax=Melittangium boletus DSM 14713 TaxID=1294270 RepID=A0A250IL62_9BACT|nr:hypothetical protein [Melittangium boletus]ATB31963.1 hypothetical protein MEBOL_005435 [Melittangium boletus DSM 14713]